MESAHKNILVINAGSSGIKLALYHCAATCTLLLSGEITGLGTAGRKLTYTTFPENNIKSCSGDNFPGSSYADFIISSLKEAYGFDGIGAIGHRIVYGTHYTEPQIIREALLNELKESIPFDPEHMTLELELVEQFKDHFPAMVQIACFDTSFHSNMPPVAKRIALPQTITDSKIRRYGFHGISYSYLIQELGNIAGKQISNGKVIIAHLGSGASLCAVSGGHSVDTSMGFTPASGVPMSTRSGDLDPAMSSFLQRSKGITPEELNRIFNHESGLLAVSETTGDLRALLLLQEKDLRAAAAVDFFCYQVKKYIGAYAAAMHGLETLIFAGGVGEHLSEIRMRICEGLQFLGIQINPQTNEDNAAVISTEESRVTVRVIKTDEQLMIATSVAALLNFNKKNYENTN